MPRMTEQVDPGLSRRAPGRRRRLGPRQWAVLGMISCGGVLGALGRHGLAVTWPHPPGGFPWATFMINVTGCLLIGAMMVLATEVWSSRRLLRPFLGVGVLGGYTSFSAYVLDTQQTLAAGAPRVAVAYLAATVITALAAVWAAAAVTRWLIRPRRRRRERR